MRVLIYTPAFIPKVDGIALRSRTHAVNLKNRGHNVQILCPYAEAPEEYEGIKICKIPNMPVYGYSESRISYPFPFFTLIKILKEFRPDIIHMIGPEFVFIPLLVVCRFMGIPLLGSYHFNVTAWLESQPLLSRTLLFWMDYLQYIFNLSDYVITPSIPMKNILNSWGLTCNDVWPPAVNSSNFHPLHNSLELRSKLTFGHPEAHLVVYVGRVAVEKSMDMLLHIVEARDDVYLAIVGAGPDVPAWLERHGEKNRIFVTGEHWRGKRLSEAYASADIFVIPSAFETLGNVVVEAMASGTVPLGCNAGGIPHMIQHRKNGLLFEHRNKADMLNCVDELLDNETFRKSLAAAGRTYAEGISWENSSDYVLKIYERVIRLHKNKIRVGMNLMDENDKSAPEMPFLSWPTTIFFCLLFVLTLGFVLSFLSQAFFSG